MGDRSGLDKLGSASIDIAGFSVVGFDALPIEVLLDVISHTDVRSAIQPTQVSSFVLVAFEIKLTFPMPRVGY
jgi:hypothetical protein